jgi:hypothetical protein
VSNDLAWWQEVIPRTARSAEVYAGGFRTFIKDQMERWGKVVKEANIKLG